MSPAPNRKRAPVRILLVDDHPIVRRGLAQLINQEKDLEVCGEAVDRGAALKEIERTQPDLAVVDLSLQSSDGLDLIKDIREQKPGLPMLVLSMHDERVYAERVLRAGARGYIMKQEALEKVLQAIRRILEGDVYLSEAVQARLMRAMVAARSKPEQSPVGQLSDRELEVFQLIGEGLGTREIAGRLGLSVKTIESHYARIKEKLDLKSATELIQSATLWVASEGGT